MASSRQKLNQRLLLLLGFGLVIFLLLVLRLFQVMVIDGPRLEGMALKQQTRRSSLHAQRGRILDTNGTVLAQSGTSYQVLVNPQVLMDKDDEEAERVRISILVSDVLGMNYDTVFEKVARVEKQQLVLKRQVSSDVVDQLIALQLGGTISFSTDYTRYYSNGKLFAQLIGFTGIDGEGQTGLEASLDEELAGIKGRLASPKDARGNPLAYGEEEYIAPINGYDVRITADANAEAYLETALAECMSFNNAKTVSGLIMDPNTGEILATAANPTFDLNTPDRSDVTSLMAMSRNRVVTDKFEAGSLFRIITLAAALDSGAITMDSTFDCDGAMTFRTETIRCTKRNGHGHQTLAEACQNSCNCAFMQMALTMGVDTFYDYIYAFGFGTKTGSRIPNEDTGKVTHRKYIRDNDLARLGFGLGITATPMQLINAVSAAVNGGIMHQPYIIEDILATGEDGAQLSVEHHDVKELSRAIRSDTSEKVRAILQSCAESGPASGGRMNGFTAGGISGVSTKLDEHGAPSPTLCFATYIGFVPADKPEMIAIFVADEPRVPVICAGTVIAPFVQRAFTNLVQYYGILPNTATETKTVPDLTGKTAREAADSLERAGFLAPIYTASEEDALVISQIPAPNTEAPAKTQVVIYTTMTTYSDEGTIKNTVRVPRLIGKRRQDAFDAANRLGLILTYDKTACLGQVLEQSIEEDTEVVPGTEIHVIFSKAPPSNTPPPEDLEDPENPEGEEPPTNE